MIRIILTFLFIVVLFPGLAEAKKPEINYGYVNYQQGVSSHKENQLESAVAYFSNALSIQPNDLPSLIKLSSVFIELSKPDLAIPLLERAEKLSPNDSHVYLLLGRALRDNKQFKEAIESYKHAVKLEPENPLINTNIGFACFLMEDHECAVTSLGKALLAYPNSLKIRAALGISYHALKKYEMAKEQYEYVLNNLKANSEILYNLAKVYIALEDYENARSILTSIIDFNGAKADSYLDRAKINYKLNQLEAAEEDYLYAITLEPVNPVIPVEYAMFLWNTGAYLKAAEMYDLALTLQPGDEEYLGNKSYLLSLAGKNEEAEKSWKEILDVNSENTLALYNLAKINEEEKKYEVAIDYYKKVIFLNDDLEAKIGLAYCLHNLKQYEDAAIAYREVLSKKNDDATTNFNFGLLLAEQNDYKNAVHYLEKAISYSYVPISNVYRALINVYKKLKDTTNLEIAYKRLIDIEKNDVDARIGYAEFLNNTGDSQGALNQYLVAVAFDKTGKSRIQLAKFLVSEKDYFGAVGQLQEYLKSHSKDLEALILLAKAYSELKIPEQAINTYKQIISIKSDNYLAYYNLGLLYEDIGKYDEAKNYLLKTIELDENYSPAYYALGLAYSLSNDKAQSIEMFQKYLVLDPQGEYKDSVIKNIEEIESNKRVETTAGGSVENNKPASDMEDNGVDETNESAGELHELGAQEVKDPFNPPQH